MPNHVTQEVVIFGEDSVLDEVEKFVAGPGKDGEKELETMSFDLNKIIPQPDDIFQGSFNEDYGGRDWYTWNTQNWGTKWNAYSHQDTVREPGKIVFKFDTAWSPPHPVIKVLAEKYPQVRIEHAVIDEGWGFAGTIIYEDGELVGEENIPCSTDSEWFMEFYHRMYGEYPETELNERDY